MRARQPARLLTIRVGFEELPRWSWPAEPDPASQRENPRGSRFGVWRVLIDVSRRRLLLYFFGNVQPGFVLGGGRLLIFDDPSHCPLLIAFYRSGQRFPVDEILFNR